MTPVTYIDLLGPRRCGAESSVSNMEGMLILALLHRIIEGTGSSDQSAQVLAFPSVIARARGVIALAEEIAFSETTTIWHVV